MIEAFLICALALPNNSQAEYMIVKRYIEEHNQNYEIVFVNENEKLLDAGAWDTWLYINGLHVWMKPKVIRASS